MDVRKLAEEEQALRERVRALKGERDALNSADGWRAWGNRDALNERKAEVEEALAETRQEGRDLVQRRDEAVTAAASARSKNAAADLSKDRVNEIADRFAQLGKAFKEAGEESKDLTWATIQYDEALAALEKGSLEKFYHKLGQVEKSLFFAEDNLTFAQARAQAAKDQKLFDSMTGVTAAAETEDKVSSFLRAFFANNDGASASEASSAAAKAFGVDLATGGALDSKAAIGAADLRSGGELTRLLSGDDGARSIVEVGKEQVELLKIIAEKAEEQALELAP